ncbi:CD1108 family mobile element protein [Helcococcus ovis]
MSKKRKKNFDEKLRLSKEKQNQDGSKVVIEDSKLKHGDDYRGKIIRDNERFQDKFQERKSKRYDLEKEDKGGKSSNRRYKLAEEKVQHQEEIQSTNHEMNGTPTEVKAEEIGLSHKGEANSERIARPNQNTNIKLKTDSHRETRESVFYSADTQNPDSEINNKASKKAQLRKQAETFRKEEKLAEKASQESEVYDPLAKDTDNDGIPDRYDNNFKDSGYFESTYDVEDPKREEQVHQQENYSRASRKTQNRKIGKDFRKQQAEFKNRNFEENKYQPLERDTDSDGITDSFDHDFKDSRYFESTFDVENQELEARNLKEVKVKLKEKQMQKYADEFGKKQVGKELHQEGSKKKNYSNEGFTRNRGKEDKGHPSKKAVSNSKTKKERVKDLAKSGLKKEAVASGLLIGAEKSQDVAKAYLSSGSEDNVGVEGAEKTLEANSKLIHKAQKSFSKRKSKDPYSLSKNNYKLREKKSKLDFRDGTDRAKETPKYKKRKAYKKFQKRRQMKSTIRGNNQTRIRDRLKKGLKEITFSVKKLVARKAKGILIGIVAVIVIGTFFINFGGSGLSVLMNTTSSTLTTTYLSEESVLNDINQAYSSKEQALREELDEIEVNYPGYDEYIISKNGDIGHNVHELFSYITARCGDVKSVSEVSEILDELFSEMYYTEYREEVEIRYRTVTGTYVDENGNEYTESHEEPYEYRKLILTLTIREMDSIIREVFASYPDNLKHYEALFMAQGNMAEVFGNADLIASNGGVGGGQEYEASSSVQKKIVDAAYITPSPGAGWCAMWVSQVYQNAGLGYIGGNANDMYRNFTYTSDRSKLQVGMLVAVESSSSGGELGAIYGHVGIYIGDGMVMDNIGHVRVTSLDNWIATFCKHSPVGFGFPPNVQK